MKRITFILALITILASCETPSKEKQALYKSVNSDFEKMSKEQPLPEEYEPIEISASNDCKVYLYFCFLASDAKRDAIREFYDDEDSFNKEYDKIKEGIIKNGKILGFSNKTINNVLTELDLETDNFDVWLKNDSRYK